MRVCFQIVWKIALSAHSFTDNKFIKECLMVASEEMYLNKKLDFQSLSLSRTTVQRRIRSMADDPAREELRLLLSMPPLLWMRAQELNLLLNCLLSSVVWMDEIFEVANRLEELRWMHWRLWEERQPRRSKPLSMLNLSWQKLAAVCADGTSATIGERNKCTVVQKWGSTTVYCIRKCFVPKWWS